MMGIRTERLDDETRLSWTFTQDEHTYISIQARHTMIMEVAGKLTYRTRAFSLRTQVSHRGIPGIAALFACSSVALSTPANCVAFPSQSMRLGTPLYVFLPRRRSNMASWICRFFSSEAACHSVVVIFSLSS